MRSIQEIKRLIRGSERKATGALGEAEEEGRRRCPWGERVRGKRTRRRRGDTVRSLSLPKLTAKH
jgi:hypothetical protein